MSDAPALLDIRGLTKRFGDLVANDAVDIRIDEGEIHALLGENGAGKSTLVKMIFGSLQPDGGTMVWRGELVTVRAPAQARQMGIGMVFQHFSLFESLSVAENIALAFDDGSKLSDIAAHTTELSVRYGLPLDPAALVGDLSVGERQRIEIIRCLMLDPALIILDEPTSVLTPQEADRLFDTLFRLRDEGRSILYISHRLEEVQRLCSRATIMRRGKVVDACDPRQETAATLANKMVGEDVEGVERRQGGDVGDVLLSVSSLTSRSDNPFAVPLRDVSLELRAGEILGIAGIAGNGQSELFAALSGESLSDDPETVRLFGAPCGHLSVPKRRAMGAAFVPEERLGHGAVPTMRLNDNLLLTRYSDSDGHFLKTVGTIARRRLQAVTERVIEAFDVRKSAPNPPAASLSGGNLQKFIMGRELDREPRVVVVNQPTWGVDAGAAARIRQALVDMAAVGGAVLIISQDLDELFEIATSMAVLADGALSSPEPIERLTRERVGLLMASSEAQAA